MDENTKLYNALGASFIFIVLIIGAFFLFFGDSLGNRSTQSNDEVTEQEINNQADIVSQILDNPNLERLSTIAQENNFFNELSGDSYTVFAPNNLAFEQNEDLISSLNSDQVLNVLRYHVVEGAFERNNLENNQQLITLSGQPLTIQIDENGNLNLLDQSGNIISVETSDINADNGVIHITNNLLIPEV